MKNLFAALNSKFAKSLAISSLGFLFVMQAQAQTAAPTPVTLAAFSAGEGAYAWVHADGKTTSHLESAADNNALASVKAANQGEYLWFSSQGKTYVLRDQATLNRLTQIWEPVEKISKQMQTSAQNSTKNSSDVAEQIEKLANSIESKNKKIDKLNYKLNTAVEREKESYNGQIKELNASLAALNAEMAKLKANLAPVEDMGKRLEQESKQADLATRALIQEVVKGGAKLAVN
ncbi:MAG: hypothetical protein HYZ45_05400 [Burkholderiales bacterium]|nr:hypothetical protein [Burkholderiales bacterium]